MKKEIKPEELTKNPFHMIGKEWMLVTAEKDGKVNTMTASWGGVGIMWGKPVAYVFIRPQRYTKEFIDGTDTFSLSILGEEHRKTLSYLGTVSGRDEDKISKSGLHVKHEGVTPYFEEANTVMVCRFALFQMMIMQDLLIKSVIRNGIRKRIITPCMWWKLRRYLWINGTSFDLDGG